MCCGRDNFLQGMLGDEFEHFQSLGSLRRRPLCWVVSCGRISVVLCLTLLKMCES